MLFLQKINKLCKIKVTDHHIEPSSIRSYTFDDLILNETNLELQYWGRRKYFEIIVRNPSLLIKLEKSDGN